MRGTARAAGASLTVIRTSSEPACASSSTWAAVAAASAVGVSVIDCTAIGRPPPSTTPPTATGTARRRAGGNASLIGVCLNPSPS